MTATEKLHQLIQSLPEQQVAEILNFAEFLQYKQQATSPIPSNTTTDKPAAIQAMRGILKTQQPALTDQDVAKLLKERRTEKFGL
ncbi:MAG: DUF2281 domain-containing protein [Cyanobacteria bacterium J06606_4]